MGAQMSKVVFGPLCDYVRNLPCLACGTWPSDPHHVKSRGAGGTDVEGHGSHGNVVNLCRTCHRELHTTGVKTWQKHHKIDLQAEAERIYRTWVGR
jgi:hypothetical protein